MTEARLIDGKAFSAIGPRTMPRGIKAEGEGEWTARKHGGPKKRLWRKLHLGMDEETLEIRAVGVTKECHELCVSVRSCG